MTTLRIAEIFGPTIQGEGALIGAPTVFVRAGGCDYRCSWCDSLHAVDSEYRHEWAPMQPEDVWQKVRDLSGDKPLTVTVSGGNPAIQDFGPLIALGKAQGYGFALETQGSVARDWFAELEMLVLSPKPPSSGETVDWAVFDTCLAKAGDAPTVLKIVIFDDADYAWARDVAARYPALPLYLQPGNHTPPPPDAEDAVIDMDGIMDRMTWLVDKTLADGWYSPRILPQLHVLLWGNKRGV
ncbi:7-carboxy-7-deazaguanine synthase QueE [Actibacterium lipolyticum]|uniref:7-carboxy-7-deazaguanine synthase n=1 Tax=Actibacterium lipolyticum TaxID=1524263 RepID=A0A238KR56_9RHOB|nr:7-carboxy-7-deazaguanine synthase QueE [Actibacterium lipolyticum]SMX45208.1 7-carboxy-7-deazaguanine synthase [Actibacterium lipolyticum]